MLWIGSGRFDGRIADGNGQRACGAPDAVIDPSAQADGTVRCPAGLGCEFECHRVTVVTGEATVTTIA